MRLRPYQQEALDVSKRRFDDGCYRQLVCLPTGTGKTPLFANIQTHHGFDKRAIVLVHTDELAEQAIHRYAEWNPGLRIGLEMGSSVSGSDDVVVASVATLGRQGNTRLGKFQPREFSSVICDEAHHSVAPTYKHIFRHFGLLDDGEGRSSRLDTIRGDVPGLRNEHGLLLFGVTATPNRGDGQGLGQVYDEIVYRMSILDAIRQGWLVDVRGLKVNTPFSLDSVRVRAGDFALNELEKAVNVDERNHLIVQSWLANAENRQTIVFCVDIAHSKKLADTFKAYGVPAEAIWGTDPDRADKLKYHKLGHLKVLCNCAVLTEGYDDWQVSCIVMARPTKSQLLFVQMAGRGLRIPKGIDNLLKARETGISLAKEDCLLMDVVDNTSRHSLVTLASVFGLPPKLDMKSRGVTRVIQQFEQAEREHPLVDLTHIESLDDIQHEIEHVELFTPRWDEQVTQNSDLRWMPTPSGEYVITLPTKETVVIYRDLLDKWHVQGSVCNNVFHQDGLHSLQEAFNQADGLIQSFGRNFLKLLRREAKWHRKKISEPQKTYLKQLYKNRPEILAGLDNLTSGEASHLISQATHNAFGAQYVRKPREANV